MMSAPTDPLAVARLSDPDLAIDCSWFNRDSTAGTRKAYESVYNSTRYSTSRIAGILTIVFPVPVLALTNKSSLPLAAVDTF